jgi:diguanylate cyclase (GGDEF)-like protein/PAS domain S-box-containing protein
MDDVRNNKIALRLAKTSVAIAFIVGLLLSSFQVYRDYLEEDERLQEITDTILHSTKYPATASVYTLSQNLAKEVVIGLFEYPFIYEAKIIDDLGNTLAEKKRPMIQPSNTRWLTNYLSSEYKEYSLTLHSSDLPTASPGKLTITIDVDSALSPFFARSLIILISGFIGNLLLVILLFVVFHTIITQPLIKLANEFKNIKPHTIANREITIPVGHDSDELSQLTHSANNLIHENHHFIKQLQQSEQRYRDLYHDNPTMFFTINPDGMILSVNNYGAEQFGYTPDELIGKSILFILHEQDKAAAQHYIKNCLEQPNSIAHWNIRKVCKDGSILWVRDVARVVVDNDKNTTILIVCADITEAQALSTELTFQANHDALTGLLNRREFSRRAEHSLSTIKKTNAEHALCFMDLDQFKIINDTCGHSAGDEMLQQLSSILQNTLRHGDTLARLGGDEFGVLFENCSLEDAQHAANSLLNAVQDYNFVWEGQNFRVGVSIGLVVLDPSINLTELLRSADAACYIAKDKGRSRIHVYNSNGDEIAQRHGEMQWISQINQALDQNRFCLFAQSIEPLSASASTSYELLIRMLDESGKIIPPNTFLPAAERYDLISKIDHWVIKNAFEQLSNNSQTLKDVNYFSINLSGSSLTNPDILTFIIEQLDIHKINNKICFEITETSAISNYNTAIKFITTLKNLGCRFALDDFGSGFSSYGYLKNIPVDYLKIDGVFVKDIVDDPLDHAMVKSINDIGHVMGMQTIAEFVENESIKELLNEMGINFIQGYYVGKPCPLGDVLQSKL